MRIVACQNTNLVERLRASSGGIFEPIAKWVLNNSGIVYGAAFDNEFGVEHVCIDNIKDLYRIIGSKYFFSKCGVYEDIKSKLSEGRLVLFVGSPCQVYGLKKYLINDNTDRLYLIDFICHGAPDQSLWKKYLKEISDKKKVRHVSFRDKCESWTNYQLVVQYEDGTEYRQNHNDNVYMKGFTYNITLRQACFHCKYKGIETRESDITLGDLWGANEIAPDLFDDKGTSLVFINTQKGEFLIDKIKETIEIRNIEEKKALNLNPSAYIVATPNCYYEMFRNRYKKTGNVKESLERFVTPSRYRRLLNVIERFLRKWVGQIFEHRNNHHANH